MANKPLTLQTLLAPWGFDGFGIEAPESSELLVGHMIEALVEEGIENLDFIDVCTMAADLGYAPANSFLRTAPQLLVGLDRFDCVAR